MPVPGLKTRPTNNPAYFRFFTPRTAAAINIETYRGVVQLTGFVNSPEQAQRAEAAAKKIEGVRSVKNDVRIKSSS